MLAACAGTPEYRPRVDLAASHRSSGEYERDLADCQAGAKSAGRPDEPTGIMAFLQLLVAGAGTVITDAVNGGDPGNRSTSGAGIGASSAGYGAAGDRYKLARAVRDCLQRRGYQVLG